jgi:hypothetical protein
MEEEKGLLTLTGELSKNILELREKQLILLDQTNIAKNIAGRTDNVDNLRLIINTMSESIEFIVERDSKVFGSMIGMLDTIKEIFEVYKNMEKSLNKEDEEDLKLWQKEKKK